MESIGYIAASEIFRVFRLIQIQVNTPPFLKSIIRLLEERSDAGLKQIRKPVFYILQSIGVPIIRDKVRLIRRSTPASRKVLIAHFVWQKELAASIAIGQRHFCFLHLRRQERYTNPDWHAINYHNIYILN